MYSLRGPMGTAWRVVTNNYWSYPDMFYSSGTINHDILPSIAQVHAIPNDSVGKEHRTGKAYFILFLQTILVLQIQLLAIIRNQTHICIINDEM